MGFPSWGFFKNPGMGAQLWVSLLGQGLGQLFSILSILLLNGHFRVSPIPWSCGMPGNGRVLEEQRASQLYWVVGCCCG